MRILVAENTIISNIMLMGSLVNYGYSVVVAENGIEAADLLLSSNGPELALLDWNMAGMNALEVCHKIRSEQKANPSYLIVLTPSCKVKDVQQCIDAGADDYVLKPFFTAELDVRIKAGIRIIKMQKELQNVNNKLKLNIKQNFIDTALLRVANY